ncbi:MAG TPA: hypothetical protein VFU47_15860 [Armatimonadota bacterium]|nr:hypothetical protein [Armatimonadota bacterium]
MPAETKPSTGSGAFGMLTAAFGDMQRLLGGPGRGRRWKALAALAAMAGIVGAGAAPPPLGMLAPLGSDARAREVAAQAPWLLPLLLFLALFLTGMGAFARSFGLAFVHGIATARPDLRDYRAHLKAGSAHFWWSSALTIPLYLLLFGGEAAVTHGLYQQLLGAADLTDQQITSLLLTAAGEFLLVLLPWTLLTLPAMVLMYELTPAAMVLTGAGPARACGLALSAGRKRAGAFAGYLGVRFLLQLLGNTVAFAALLPCLLVSAVLTLPLTLGGWALSGALGGPGTSGGAVAATTAGLLSLVVLYCVLCAALLPVSVVLNAFALRAVRSLGIAD